VDQGGSLGAARILGAIIPTGHQLETAGIYDRGGSEPSQPEH
jgi:hypothetical protein